MEGAPKQYTKEEIAELEKSRTISDAELLKNGAEYMIGDNGEKELLVNNKQKDAAMRDMYSASVSNTFERDEFARELIKGGASYIENEKGERHLVLTNHQIQDLKDKINKEIESKNKYHFELVDFINTQDGLEKIPFFVRPHPYCCDTFYYSDDENYLIEYSTEQIGIKLEDPFITVGCNDDYTLIYKGRIAGYSTNKSKEDFIDGLRKKYESKV